MEGLTQLNQVKVRGMIGGYSVQTDKRHARLSVVTTFALRDGEGRAVIDTSWHNIVIDSQCYVPELQNVKKGDKIEVVGRIRYRHYTDNAGIDKISTEIAASNIKLLSVNCLDYQVSTYNLKKKFVCDECGSDKVIVKAWVDANTNEYQSDIDEDGTAWCEECEQKVRLKEVELKNN